MLIRCSFVRACLVLFLLLISTAALGDLDKPDMVLDEKGFVCVTLVVEQGSGVQPLVLERIRKPIGELTASSKTNLKEWEDEYYDPKYVRKIPPSAKLHCAGHIIHYLAQHWRKDPAKPTFPNTKIDTDLLVHLFQVLQIPKETKGPPRVGDVIFWSKKEIKEQKSYKPGVKHDDNQHFAYVRAILPNGEISLESKDGDQSTFWVTMPADPNTMWRNTLLGEWTRSTHDTLLNFYRGAHRYRPLDRTDVKVSWRYWVPQSADIKGYWVDKSDRSKVYRIRVPLPVRAEEKLPITFTEACGQKRSLLGGFQDEHFFFAQNYGEDEKAPPKRMARYTKDKIEWLGPSPKVSTHKGRDVVRTWVRTEPFLALRKVERWVQTSNSKPCGDVGKERVKLPASSGTFDVCFWDSKDWGFRKNDGTIFYDFHPGKPFVKDGKTNKATIPLTVKVTRADFTAKGNGLDHHADVSLGANVERGSGATSFLAKPVNGRPEACGNYLTSLEPIVMSASHSVYAGEVGDSLGSPGMIVGTSTPTNAT